MNNTFKHMALAALLSAAFTGGTRADEILVLATDGRRTEFF